MRLALFLVALLAAQDQRSPGYAAYKKANELFVAKRIPEAIQSLQQSLKQDEKLIPALTLYAKIAMTMNRFELAKDSLERALEVDANAAYARFLYGLNFYLANDLPHAQQQLELARRVNPIDARAALYLGLTHESLGHTDQAMELYRESARLDAQVETLLAGARLLYLQNRLDECAQWLRKAVQREPNSRDAHFELARVYLLQDNPAAAAKEGEQALALKDGTAKDAQIHYLLIRAYRLTNPVKAAQHAELIKGLEQ